MKRLSKVDKALLASLKHWDENVEAFKAFKVAGFAYHWGWFAEHCFDDNCAMCKHYAKVGKPICNSRCPLGKDGMAEHCCGGKWQEAMRAALEDGLTLRHLRAVRNYIRKVCRDRGILGRKI